MDSGALTTKQQVTVLRNYTKVGVTNLALLQEMVNREYRKFPWYKYYLLTLFYTAINSVKFNKITVANFQTLSTRQNLQ